MVVPKQVEYEIADTTELESFLRHLRERTSQVEGVTFKEIYFESGIKEFVLSLVFGMSKRGEPS